MVDLIFALCNLHCQPFLYLTSQKEKVDWENNENRFNFSQILFLIVSVYACVCACVCVRPHKAQV